MQNVHQQISIIKAYAERVGETPENVCRKATGNGRFFARLERKAEQILEDWNRLQDYMDQHPAPFELVGNNSCPTDDTSADANQENEVSNV